MNLVNAARRTLAYNFDDVPRFISGLPMTMKSCFYPLIGDKIFGWMGDLIDMVSILTTLFGVCTSLGLGTRQLNAGFTMINPEINPNSLTIQVTKNL